MNVEDAIAPPETNNQVEIYGDQDAPEGMYSGFVGANASYFAQAFAPLNEVFGNDGAMKVVSDEEDYIVVVAVRHIEGANADEDGVMDVDCAILEANQQSLSGCLTALD